MPLTKIKSKTGIEWHNAFSISADNVVSFIGDSSNSTWSKVANAWHNDDNTKVDFGTSSDLSIYHDGTDSYITNTPDTGHLIIKGDSIKLVDNDHGHNYLVATQDGSVDLYHNEIKTLSTDANGAGIYGPEAGNCELFLYADEGDDNADKWKLKAAQDGTYFYLQNYNSGSWETNIKATGDGSVELYHNGTKKLETMSNGVTITGNCWADAFYLGDNEKSYWGTGDDLQIYHDGSHSYIHNDGTGNLALLADGVYINNEANTQNMITAVQGGAVSLFHADSKRLETSTNGIKVSRSTTYSDSNFTSDEDSGLVSRVTLGTTAAPAKVSLMYHNDTERGTLWTEGAYPLHLGYAGASRMNTATNGVYFPERVLIKTTTDNDYSTSTSALVIGCDSGWATHASKVYITKADYAEGGGGVSMIACRRSANSAYTFLGMYSGNGTTSITSDREFNFLGDGDAYADGSWTGSGADYAEFFEWKDGNASAEDRVGISVVLDGDKIKEASAGEEPIGVISGNPVVVGDAAWNKWTDKYLKDDYGRYVWETYTITEWTNSDGKLEQYETDRIPSGVTAPSDATVKTKDEKDNILTRRKANPSYDPSKTYTAREDRKEWDTVGLVGKLRVKKGQVTGSSWIKMRDISSNVEEWLVK